MTGNTAPEPLSPSYGTNEHYQSLLALAEDAAHNNDIGTAISALQLANQIAPSLPPELRELTTTASALRRRIAETLYNLYIHQPGDTRFTGPWLLQTHNKTYPATLADRSQVRSAIASLLTNGTLAQEPDPSTRRKTARIYTIASPRNLIALINENRSSKSINTMPLVHFSVLRFELLRHATLAAAQDRPNDTKNLLAAALYMRNPAVPTPPPPPLPSLQDLLARFPDDPDQPDHDLNNQPAETGIDEDPA